MGLLERLRRTSPAEVEVTTVFGDDSLEVHGESNYQQNLRKVVASFGRELAVILKPEPKNPYDSNAVAVMAGGLLVGYMTRTDAAIYQRPILDLMKQYNRPVAVRGRIFGGEGGKTFYGIWLYHDRADFGLTSHKPTPEGSHVRTGESEAESKWMDGLPADHVAAIKYLRHELAQQSDPLQRHFVFLQLERNLYACRDVFDSALTDYFAACELHHREMATIRPRLVTLFSGIPFIPTYRQVVIAKQKAGAFADALEWAERGLTVYGDQCLRPADGTDDLRKRAEKLRTKASQVQ